MAKKLVAAVNHSHCDNSPFCLVIRGCPKQCIQRDGSMLFGNKPQVDQDDCAGCGKCVDLCPHGAVRMKKARA